ncbi:uncharacterized protein N7482_007625 [Penicillium canariense]|uniref:Uncharacterized protein n=1 Tax=Penicillium canariense TaxID=189055 RepID=A0A9W9LKS5_9EURO|nr:uncharacterized protein N7482_007625 [Penicillium canariense]KAJ5160621.1 hypothetical protein N7482_007625 [Penicillium canariense]
MSASQISPLVTQREVIHAYRHLYRQGLKAIRYATPGRHVLRTTLRTSFGAAPPEEFDRTRIANTLRFFERAADMTGLEHRIIKNLLLTRYWELPQNAKESRLLRSLGLGNAEHQIRKSAYDQFNLTLERLNESLGTCLK